MKTTEPIPKVLAYITRDGFPGREVLVFRHRHNPDAGIQVPGGTVEPGEDVITALHREVQEESGLTGLTVIAKLAVAPFFAAWRGELQDRNIFHLQSDRALPTTWIHVVEAGEEDAGLAFEFFWLPLAEAAQVLRWGQGNWLAMLDAESV